MKSIRVFLGFVICMAAVIALWMDGKTYAEAVSIVVSRLREVEP